MRLFLAIELPESVRSGILSLAFDALADWDLPSRSFVRLENIHLTVKFIGEASEAQLPVLCDCLGNRRLPVPLLLHADRVKCLPKRGPVRILSASVAGNIEALHFLHAEVESACEEAGVPREARSLTPHVTFARLRTPLPGGDRSALERIALPARAAEPFVVTQVVLFQSYLEPSGPRYVPLARFS